MHQRRMDGKLTSQHGEGNIMQDKPRRNAESNFIGLLNFIADPQLLLTEKGFS
jgi:hypothetical protein